MSRERKQRAIALMSTFFIVLFLLILTGALIRTQSGVFALVRTSDRARESRIASRSLHDYCLYEIEHNRNWGKGGFDAVADVLGERADDSGVVALSDRISVQYVEGNLFGGQLTDEGLPFQVEVLNALTGGAPVTGESGVTAQPEQVIFVIEVGTLRGGEFRSVQRVVSMLELAPLFDASVLSRGDVSIEGQEVVFASKDRRRNEMRTEGVADLPGLTQGKTRFLEFDPSLLDGSTPLDSLNADHRGLLYAGSEIQENGVGLDSEQLVTASQESGGRIVSNGTKRVDIFQLESQNVAQQASENLTNQVEVPPGEFRFTQVEAVVTVRRTNDDGSTYITTENQTLDVCSYYDPPGSFQPQKVLRGDIDKSVAGTGTIIDVVIPPPEGVSDLIPVDIGEKFYLDSGFQGSNPSPTGKMIPELGIRSNAHDGSGPVEIDLRTHTVTVESGTHVRPKSRPEGSPLPPSSFALTVEKGTRPSFVMGSANNDVVFEVDGDVKLGDGTTDGLGTIISKQGSITLEPRPHSMNFVSVINDEGEQEWVLEEPQITVSSSNNQSGLVLFAEKDVNVLNPGLADWAFRGFVYANGSFNFDVGGQRAFFFGSVVAQGRDLPEDTPAIAFKNSDRISFIYDPGYLKELTRHLPNNWTRLESTVWNSD